MGKESAEKRREKRMRRGKTNIEGEKRENKEETLFFLLFYLFRILFDENQRENERCESERRRYQIWKEIGVFAKEAMRRENMWVIHCNKV